MLTIRAIDIDTTRTVWSYRLEQHKTAHHGSDREIYFGPQAQAALSPFMVARPVDEPLFSPIEAERERHLKANNHRREDQQPNQRKTDRLVGSCYTTNSYRRAIHRACDLAKVPRWSSHRLRHSAATRLRDEVGIDITQTILGHKLGSTITELYAEANTERAREVMERVG